MSRCRFRPCRIRQAKGELHRPCRIRQAKGELYRARVQVSPPWRSESLKLRGNSTGHAPRCRLRCRVESVKLRGNSTGLASRCRLRPCRIRQAKGELPGVASARVESVKLRGNSTGHADRCRLRPCRIRQAKGELHRARVQVSPPPVSNPSSQGGTPKGTCPGVASALVESVKLRGNSQVSPPPVSNPSS